MGERDLQKLLSGMTPVLDACPYVFLCVESKPSGIQSVMEFVEDEGLTLICSVDEARKAGLMNEEKEKFARITLSIHSDLQAVGLTASVSAALTNCNIPANVVAAFHHDHVFVPFQDADSAMKALKDLSDAA